MENKEEEGMHVPNMTHEDYDAMSLELRRNKEQMIHILQHNPKVGVYRNETREEWEKFFIFFINFLKSEIGPRGDCAKAVRTELLKREAEINEALLPFNQNARTHIRDIYMKNKFFIPCPEYTQLIKMEEINQRSKTSLQRLQDPLSPMRKAISEGLLAKHGPEFDLQAEFTRLQVNYALKISEADVEIARLREVVNACPQYHEYMRVKEIMEPYFKQWQEADSGMGKENLKTGQAFEDKVNAQVLPYLLAREKSDPKWQYSNKKFEVFTNLSWIPRNLGEIDIAFGYRDEVQNRYFIFTLIQCKSRLFDLREAYKQVSLDDREALNKGPTFQELKEMKRIKLAAMNNNKKKSKKEQQLKKQGGNQQQSKPKEEQKKPQQGLKQEKQEPHQKPPVMGKKFLSTKYGPAELVDNHHFYIITTLPQNQFVLPIESKMKQSIQKYSKNRFIQDMQSEPLYLLLRDVFKERLSPLEWLLNYEKNFGEGQSNVLVLR